MNRYTAILLSCLFFTSSVESTQLFFVDVDRASTVALREITAKYSEVNEDNLTLQKVDHYFDNKYDFESPQLLNIHFSSNERQSNELKNAAIYVVTLNETGKVISTEKNMTTTSGDFRRKIHEADSKKECIRVSNILRAKLSMDEVCEYGYDSCLINHDEQKHMVVFCSEDTMGECYEKKAWQTINGVFGVSEDVAINNVNVDLAKKEFCGYMRKW